MGTLTTLGIAEKLIELGMAGPQVNTGDLIVGDSSIAPLEAKKVTIGADDEVLVVDSSTSTGLDWKSRSEIPHPIVVVTGNTTLDSTHSIVLANAKDAAITITLPAASGVTGRVYTVKKSDTSSNTVTIADTGSAAIDGDVAGVIITQPYDAVKLAAVSNVWWII